jgi:hypothetical protein
MWRHYTIVLPESWNWSQLYGCIWNNTIWIYKHKKWYFDLLNKSQDLIPKQNVPNSNLWWIFIIKYYCFIQCWQIKSVVSCKCLPYFLTRMKKSCGFVLQYNTEALVLILHYYFGNKHSTEQKDLINNRNRLKSFVIHKVESNSYI